jgi:uncharacterized protein (TIGR01244 family)
MFRQLDVQVYVSDSPVVEADMAEAASRGITLAVNNRPDGEEADQVDAPTLAAAAEAAGLAYLHIPVSTDFTDEKVAALSEAMDGTEGKVLIFCRTGTRSTYLWALARAREGAVPEALQDAAAQAGYSLRPLMSWLRPGTGTPG